MIGVAFVGLVGIAGLYWSGVSLLIAATVLVMIFPVYLVIAAALLNSWLGYGGEAIPLKRVTEEEAAAPDDAFPTRETPAEDRAGSRFGRYLQRTAENPRTHIVVIASAVLSGLVASLLGRDGIAFFVFGFGFLAAVAALQIPVWHRLKRAYERRADEGGTDGWHPIGGRSAEIKAGLSVAILLIVLLVLGITVLRILLV